MFPEPEHYQLLKRAAQRFVIRSSAKKTKDGKWRQLRYLTPTELDDIASAGSIYFVECCRTSKITDRAKRRRVAASRAARRATVEYWRNAKIGGGYINTAAPEAMDELEQPEQRASQLDKMLADLKDDRQRLLALHLANGSPLELITEDCRYKTRQAAQYGKKQIAKRLAPYAPECHLMRAVREACELFIRSPFPKVEPSPQERDNDSRDEQPQPRRAKSSKPVDIAIPAMPGEFRPMPELWAKHIGLGQGRGNVAHTIASREQPQEQPQATYWNSPIIAQLENSRYQRWLSTFAR